MRLFTGTTSYGKYGRLSKDSTIRYDNRVGLVRSGASVVRTKWSGALLSAHLACALLAQFASEVRSSQAKCALKIRVSQAKCALKSAPDQFCDLRPSQVRKRAQNPTLEWS